MNAHLIALLKDCSFFIIAAHGHCGLTDAINAALAQGSAVAPVARNQQGGEHGILQQTMPTPEPTAAPVPSSLRKEVPTPDADIKLAEDTILDIERAGFKGIVHPDAALYGGKVQRFAYAVLRIMRDRDAALQESADKFSQGFTTGTILMISERQFKNNVLETLAQHNHCVHEFRDRAEKAERDLAALKQAMSEAAKGLPDELTKEAKESLSMAVWLHIKELRESAIAQIAALKAPLANIGGNK